MDKDKLARRLLATFQEELGEHVGALNENLLALEKDPAGPESPARVKSLFRAAHSLKGAARSVSIRPIEEMCHHMEEVLRAVQGGVVTVEKEIFAILFAAADALDDARKRLAGGQDLAAGPLDELSPRLAALAARQAKTPAPQPPVPSGRSSILLSAPPGEAVETGAAVAEGIVRVAAPKLDLLLARSGELLVAQGRLERAEARVAAIGDTLAQVGRELKHRRQDQRLESGSAGRSARAELEAKFGEARAAVDRLGITLRDDRRAIVRAASLMDEAVRRMRLLPFAEACQALERAVRDLAKAKETEVELVVEGASIEIDRSILEGLRDPLRALVRNAVDHGIETPARRRAAGKPEQGRVVVAAAMRGSSIEVSVADDGSGVDLAAVRARARQRGLPLPHEDRDCFALLFEPGFSTAEQVTEISGRGVGLDIVKTSAEALHGRVELISEPGRGTRVILTLPATLTTIRALLLAAAGETFAVPAASVLRLLRIDSTGIRSAGGREVVPDGEGPPIPIVPLASVLGLRGGTGPATRKVTAVVVGAPARVAFAVDELIAEREILVKALGPRIGQVGHVAGATILETGRVALILNVAELVRTAMERPGEAALAAGQAVPQARKRIILADDSVTTRNLERSILESAGYEVLIAVDGEQAWRLLLDRGADLLVSDVDMPRMGGISLCKAVRASKRFRDLPVVLVTGLESEEDRARGGEAGADAYIVKSSFDQRDLLSTISSLLGGGA
ncbi:MAG: response regulator [Myxococcales bacterium]|nr:response regulator [Myxococcales bacterium]